MKHKNHDERLTFSNSRHDSNARYVSENGAAVICNPDDVDEVCVGNGGQSYVIREDGIHVFTTNEPLPFARVTSQPSELKLKGKLC